jgi:hypothetical protein
LTRNGPFDGPFAEELVRSRYDPAIAITRPGVRGFRAAAPALALKIHVTQVSIMANRTEVILRWAYSELTSERFREDMANVGVPASLFELADSGAPYGEMIAQSPELRVPLLRALYLLRHNNIAMLLNEEHEVENWAENDVLKLRVVPANGDFSIGEYMKAAPSGHPQDPRVKVAEMTDAELKDLPETPGIVGLNGSRIVLLDGTSRTLARLRRGDTEFPMWTPASLKLI